MTSYNIAMVFTPCLIKPKIYNDNDLLKTFQLIYLLQLLIDKNEDFFGIEKNNKQKVSKLIFSIKEEEKRESIENGNSFIKESKIISPKRRSSSLSIHRREKIEKNKVPSEKIEKSKVISEKVKKSEVVKKKIEKNESSIDKNEKIEKNDLPTVKTEFMKEKIEEPKNINEKEILYLDKRDTFDDLVDNVMDRINFGEDSDEEERDIDFEMEKMYGNNYQNRVSIQLKENHGILVESRRSRSENIKNRLSNINMNENIIVGDLIEENKFLNKNVNEEKHFLDAENSKEIKKTLKNNDEILEEKFYNNLNEIKKEEMSCNNKLNEQLENKNEERVDKNIKENENEEPIEKISSKNFENFKINNEIEDIKIPINCHLNINKEDDNSKNENFYIENIASNKNIKENNINIKNKFMEESSKNLINFSNKSSNNISNNENIYNNSKNYLNKNSINNSNDSNNDSINNSNNISKNNSKINSKNNSNHNSHKNSHNNSINSEKDLKNTKKEIHIEKNLEKDLKIEEKNRSINEIFSLKSIYSFFKGSEK